MGVNPASEGSFPGAGLANEQDLGFFESDAARVIAKQSRGRGRVQKSVAGVVRRQVHRVIKWMGEAERRGIEQHVVPSSIGNASAQRPAARRGDPPGAAQRNKV